MTGQDVLSFSHYKRFALNRELFAQELILKGSWGGGSASALQRFIYSLDVLLTKYVIIFSSQEPDAKRQRVDDGSGAATALTDAQAQNSAYNYNWYQVLASAKHQY